MVEVNKFESMTPEALQETMWHHFEAGSKAFMEGRIRTSRAHFGWHNRLDEVHLRRFGVQGVSIITKPDFLERHRSQTRQKVRMP
ncbi:MAG: hypothetical protein AAB414_04330 [Patescibacteria group bacterium]